MTSPEKPRRNVAVPPSLLSDRVAGYEAGLAAFAQRLLRGHEGLDPAIESLASAVEVDAVYVQRNYTHQELGAASEVVCHVGLADTDRGNIWDDYLWSEVPLVHRTLSEGRPWIFRSSSELADGPERDRYDRINPRVASELTIPIMVDERFAGCVSFVSVTEARDWHEAEVTFLATAADMIGLMWTRAAQERLVADLSEKRASALRIQTALLDCSQALLRGADADAITRSLAAMRSATDTSFVYIDVNVLDPERGECAEVRYASLRPGLEVDFAPFLDRFEWADAPNARDALRNRQIWGMDVNNPPAAPEATFLAQFDGLVRAELTAPIFVDEEWVATAGLIDHRLRAWSSGERRMLESVVDMFGSYWKIERSEAELSELLRSKDRFIASVSHELRTPLAAVVGYTAELNERSNDFDPEEQREILSLVAEQAFEVSHIVEDLLVAARAETAQTVVVCKPVDLSAIVELAMKTIPPGLLGHVSVRERGSVMVSGDAGRLRQIVRNLLTNAHRHGGDEVFVTVSAEGGLGLIRVSDNGVPIPESERELMFEPYRSLGEPDRPLPSIGLGLTVSRQLARLMGGDLIYSHPGESTFELSIPLA